MKNLTAVEWLEEQMKTWGYLSAQMRVEIIEHAKEKGKIASIFIAGGISAMSGFAFTGLVAMQLGIDQQKIDLIIGLSWALGLSSIAIVNWMANFMAKREHLGIDQVAQDLNAMRKGQTPKPPVQRVRRLRVKK